MAQSTEILPNGLQLLQDDRFFKLGQDSVLLSHGVTVWRNAMLEIHVSGHACQEELKLMHALTKPKYFMPIHGEYKHMIAHKELAEYMGML